jgi:microcystin-dependent protein
MENFSPAGWVFVIFCIGELLNLSKTSSLVETGNK